MKAKATVDIILNVVLATAVISMFFFTYATRVEEDVTKQQSEFVAKNLMGDLGYVIPSDVQRVLSDQLRAPNLAKQDQQAADSNAKVKQEAFQVVAVFGTIGIIVAALIANKFGVNFWTSLKQSVIMAMFIGLTEYVFLKYIASNYFIADPNFVKYIVIDTFQKGLY